MVVKVGIRLKIMERVDQQVNQLTELVKELKSERSYRGTERLVQLVIQALLDLGIMAISAVGGRTPKGYSEIGTLLADLGLLDEKDAKVLKSMAGMRNLLVHAYAIVDKNILISSASRLVEDAPRIAKTLREGLKGRTIDPPAVDEMQRNLQEVFKGRVKAAFLFGGRAKGYSLKGDYDISVYFGKPHDLYDLGELAIDVAKALNVDEDKVDIIDLDSATPEIVLEALNGTPLFVEDEYVVFELKVKAALALLDIKSGIHAYLKR
ncbi:MAG: type VII toxin-antitoxin system HepT family RNase toxin [Candidatus Bathyarchaeia archaeon]